MATIGTDITTAIRHLRQGDPIGLPTETVYGLAAKALDEAAVVKIFQVKNRPSFDPLIVHVASLAQAQEHVSELPESARILAQATWPGPLTLLLPKAAHIPDLVTSGLPKVGIRVPNHPLALELLRQVDFPLAAPSANPFGYVSPTTAQHVQDQLGAAIPYILDGGPCTVGVESTIVGFENEKAIVYRLGGKKLEDIESLIGRVTLRLNKSSNPIAPGMLATHYAPRKPVILGDISELLPRYQGQKVGVISFQQDWGVTSGTQLILSPTGDLEEAARKIFSALRMLDTGSFDVILSERFPDVGLGRAINDRLTRASVR